MTCDNYENLLNAQLDRELTSEDREKLNAHLAGCAGCRVMREAIAAEHDNLRRTFLSRRRAAENLAESIIAQLPQTTSRRVPWLAMILSAAAGFAIAFGLFHRSADPAIVHQTPQTPAPTPIAHLALATGAVEFMCPGQSGWSSLVTGGEVQRNTLVRTGPDIRCEFRTTDGSEIRLNAQTQVELKTPRQFELTCGEVWSTVAHDPKPFQAVSMGTVFTAIGTQFDLTAQANSVVLTVAEGSVAVEGKAGSETLQFGEQLTVAEGHLGGKSAARDLSLATRWVNEILVMKGRDNPELARRIDDLFAQIGQQKMGFMFEDEIRGLGDHCVIPLAKFIQSDRSRDEPARRATAARIIADVAPPWAIPNLIELLQDPDSEVRRFASIGLRRLTGRDAGNSPEQWRAWWGENRARFPGAPALESRALHLAKQPTPMKKG